MQWMGLPKNYLFAPGFDWTLRTNRGSTVFMLWLLTLNPAVVCCLARFCRNRSRGCLDGRGDNNTLYRLPTTEKRDGWWRHYYASTHISRCRRQGEVIYEGDFWLAMCAIASLPTWNRIFIGVYKRLLLVSFRKCATEISAVLTLSMLGD